jgi:hypothetical protein
MQTYISSVQACLMIVAMRQLRLAGLEIWWEYINAIVIGAAGG